MTALAQILVDAGKTVSGCDVAENFVTQPLLESMRIVPDTSFHQELSDSVDCVIYTAAHHGPDNPVVQSALSKNVPVYSQAAALADWFNTKTGIAIAGTSGKSTTTAMIAWILEYNQRNPSYAVGVGNVPNLHRTGKWNNEGRFFVAEADEYVTDPQALVKGQAVTPRFSYLKPTVTVCTNLKHEHIDVYPTFTDLQKTFLSFFQNVHDDGSLVIHGDDAALQQLAEQSGKEVFTFGEATSNFVRVSHQRHQSGQNLATVTVKSKEYVLKMKLPGKHNVLNAAAAIAACISPQVGLTVESCLAALAEFLSTKRRFEYLGEKMGITFYDDYGHHPQEVKAAITTLHSLFPNRQTVVAFQPHTFSRTKAFFPEFVSALGVASHLILLDIFSSAREQADPEISSTLLAKKIQLAHPTTQVVQLATIENLAQHIQDHVPRGAVVLTLGAGDIYQVFDLLPHD